MTLKNTGLRLREIRKEKKMTQTEFADLLGTSQRNISKYENKRLEIPDKIKAELIKFGVNMNWLLTGKGGMFLNIELGLLEALNSHPTIEKIVLILGNLEDEGIKNIEGMLKKEQKMKDIEEKLQEMERRVKKLAS